MGEESDLIDRAGSTNGIKVFRSVEKHLSGEIRRGLTYDFYYWWYTYVEFSVSPYDS